MAARPAAAGQSSGLTSPMKLAIAMTNLGAADRGREDAERLVEEGRGDDSELASYLRIVKRELEAGGFHYLCHG